MKEIPKLHRKLDQVTPEVLSSYESPRLSVGDLCRLAANKSALASPASGR